MGIRFKDQSSDGRITVVFKPLLQYVGPHCFHYCHRNSICIARSDDPKNVGLVLYNVYRNIVFHFLTFLSTPFAIKKIRSTAYFQKSTVFLLISNMCFGMFHNLIYLVIQMGATALKILYKQRVKKGTYVLEIDGTRFRKFCNAQYSPFDCWEVREKKEAFHVVLDKTKLVLYANGRKVHRRTKTRDRLPSHSKSKWPTGPHSHSRRMRDWESREPA